MLPQSTTALSLSYSSSLGHIGDLNTCLLLVFGCPKQKRNVKYLIKINSLYLVDHFILNQSQSFPYYFIFIIDMLKTYPRLKLDLHATHKNKKVLNYLSLLKYGIKTGINNFKMPENN